MHTLHLNSGLLLAAVKQAAGLVVPNPVVPIVENILVVVSRGTVTLHSSNLEANLSVTLAPSQAPLADFSICLPAKLLQTTLQNLPSQPIVLEVDLNTFACVLKAGKGRYRLAGENARDWPHPQVAESLTQLQFTGPLLAAALLAAAPFVMNDINRPEMGAVLLDLRELGAGNDIPVRTVGCDGHRISWHSFTPSANPGPRPYRPGRYLVPAAVAKLLAGLCQKADTVTVQLGPWLTATPASGEWALSCRLVDQRYPDYENVIPLGNPNVLLVERATLLQALRRVQGFANEKTSQIGLALAPGLNLTVWAESVETGHEAQDEAEADYQGEEMQIGFNSKYLEACLQTLPEGTVHIEMSTPNRAARLRPAQLEAGAPFTELLLMPVMLPTLSPTLA